MSDFISNIDPQRIDGNPSSASSGSDQLCAVDDVTDPRQKDDALIWLIWYGAKSIFEIGSVPNREVFHEDINGRGDHIGDAQSFGGQAGASARIESYLGFRTGISGRDLTGRAYVQAQKFGAEMVIPTDISRLDCAQNPLMLEFGDGGHTKASAVVIASGARYRRLDVPI